MKTQTIPLVSLRLLQSAGIYLLIALLLGIVMAASGMFQLRGVHTHINLLGWVSMAICGVLYLLLPQLASNPLARWHFWLHSLGLPPMMIALGLYHMGYPAAEPVLGIASVITASGLLLFVINLLRNAPAATVEDIRSRPAAAAHTA